MPSRSPRVARAGGYGTHRKGAGRDGSARAVSQSMTTMQDVSAWEPYHMYFPAQNNLLPYPTYSTPTATPQTSPDFMQGTSYLLPMMEQQQQQQQCSSAADDKKKSRRYKTPSPQILRVRRSAANDRERKRMNLLNVAFDQLRLILPNVDAGRRLSKFETLQMAQAYMESLKEILSGPDTKPKRQQ